MSALFLPCYCHGGIVPFFAGLLGGSGERYFNLNNELKNDYSKSYVLLRTFIPESYGVTTKYKYIHCQQKFTIQHLLIHLKLLFYFHLNKQTSFRAVSASKII